MFVGFTNIEKNGVNSTFMLLCTTGIPTSIGKEYNISCFINIEKGKSLEYDDIYLLPYSLPYKIQYPYEIIINETIKGSSNHSDIEPDPEPEPEPGPEPEPEPDFSNFLKISVTIFILTIFLF